MCVPVCFVSLGLDIDSIFLKFNLLLFFFHRSVGLMNFICHSDLNYKLRSVCLNAKIKVGLKQSTN